MKKDEKLFFVEFYKKTQQSVPVRDIVNKSCVGKKKGWLYLAGWGNTGLYDFGISIELGGLTESGKKIAKLLEGEK